MKIAILTFESPQANAIIERLLAERPGQVCGIVRSDVIVAGKNAWQSVSFLSRRTGLGFVARKGAEVLLIRAGRVWRSLTSKSSPLVSLAELAARFAVPLVGSRNVNAPETLETLRQWSPDLVVSVSLNQLIRAPLIALPPAGVINVHGGRLPENRGLFPYFWALANGDAEAGATVHWVDPHFDTGDILAQERFPIEAGDTVNSLAWKTTHLGADLLLRAIELIEAGNPPRQPQDPTGARYFSWPTHADVRRLKQRGRRYGSIFEDRPATAARQSDVLAPQQSGSLRTRES